MKPSSTRPKLVEGMNTTGSEPDKPILAKPKSQNEGTAPFGDFEPRQIQILARRPKLSDIAPPPTSPPTTAPFINTPQPATAGGFRPRPPRPSLMQTSAQSNSSLAATTPIPPPMLTSSSQISTHTTNASTHRKIDAATLQKFKQDINEARNKKLDQREGNKLVHIQQVMRIFNTLYLYRDNWAEHLDPDYMRWTLIVISETLEKIIKMRQFGVELDFLDREIGGNKLKTFLPAFLEKCYNSINNLDCDLIQKDNFVNFCLYISKLMGKLPAKFVKRIERDLNANAYNEIDISMLRNAFTYLCTVEQLAKDNHPYKELNARLAKKRVEVKNAVIDEHALQGAMAACLSSANIATTTKLFKMLMTDSDELISNFTLDYLLKLIWDFRRLESILSSENSKTEKIEEIKENWQAVKGQLILKIFAVFTSDTNFSKIKIKDHINNLLCFCNLRVADNKLQEYLDLINNLDECANLGPMELGKVKDVVKKRNLNLPDNIKKRFAYYPTLYRSLEDNPPEPEKIASSSSQPSYPIFNPHVSDSIRRTEQQVLESFMENMFFNSESMDKPQEPSASKFNPDSPEYYPRPIRTTGVDEKDLSQFLLDIKEAQKLLLGEKDKYDRFIHFKLIKRIIHATFKYGDNLAKRLDVENCLCAITVVSRFLEHTMRIREFGVALDISNITFADHNLKQSFDGFLRACFYRLSQTSYHQSTFANICYYICKLKGYLPPSFRQRIENESHLYSAFDLGLLRDALAFLCPVVPPYDSFDQYKGLYRNLLSQENLILPKINIDSEALKHITTRCIRLANVDLSYSQELLTVLWDISDEFIASLQVNYITTLIYILSRIEGIVTSKDGNNENDKIRKNWQMVKDRIIPKLSEACIRTTDSNLLPISLYFHANNLYYLQQLGSSTTHLKNYLQYLTTMSESSYTDLSPREAQIILDISTFCRFTFPQNMFAILHGKITPAAHLETMPVPFMSPQFAVQQNILMFYPQPVSVMPPPPQFLQLYWSF